MTLHATRALNHGDVEGLESKTWITQFRMRKSATSVSFVIYSINALSHFHHRALTIPSLKFHSIVGALGTRNYAAPEITSSIRNLVVSLNDSYKRPQKTLGACVSNYGMDADAFSVGATIRYMVTG